jgi:hypothetical protein
VSRVGRTNGWSGPAGDQRTTVECIVRRAAQPPVVRRQRTMKTETAQPSADLRWGEWRHIVRCYTWFAGVTGVPCAGLSTFFWTPAWVAGWLYCIVALPVIMGAVTVLWGVTAYPLLLLVGVLFGRGETSAGSLDPEGPGVVICPFGVVAGSHAQRPNNADAGRPGPRERLSEHEPTGPVVPAPDRQRVSPPSAWMVWCLVTGDSYEQG